MTPEEYDQLLDQLPAHKRNRVLGVREVRAEKLKRGLVRKALRLASMVIFLEIWAVIWIERLWKGVRHAWHQRHPISTGGLDDEPEWPRAHTD